jgi:hypothetical protein
VLVAINLVAVAFPLLAMADSGGQVAGEIAGKVVGGCCASMAGAMIQGTSSRSGKKPPPDGARPVGEDGATPRERCLGNEYMSDCYSHAIELERPGTPAAKAHALVYYRRACVIGPHEEPCADAERVATELGCPHPFACAALDLDGPAVASALDFAAAQAAFEQVERNARKRCRNDVPHLRAIRVHALVEPDGGVAAVWAEAPRDDSLIGVCVDDLVHDLRVPAFAGDEIEVMRTISLDRAR